MLDGHGTQEKGWVCRTTKKREKRRRKDKADLGRPRGGNIEGVEM